MLRRILLPLAALLALLAGCAAPLSPAAPTATALPPTRLPATPTAAATATSARLGKTPGCSVASVKPTPGPTQKSLFPTVREGDQVSGQDDASITIIEYSDFQ